MKERDFGMKAAIIREDGKMLVVKRSQNESHGKGEWEVPGGKVEIGQAPKDALKREVKEETNLEIEVLEPFETWYFEKSDQREAIGVDFLCAPESNKVELSEEHSDFKWVEKQELEEIEMYGNLKENCLKALEIWQEEYRGN